MATPKLEFNEAIMTGDEVIDTQHRYLIDLINEIADVVDNGTAETELGPILPMLQYFVEWHFDREEQCMNRRNCPFADVNKQAHTAFLETVATLKDQYHRDGASQELALHMHTQLCDWLVTHIQGIDAKIRDFPEPVEA